MGFDWNNPGGGDGGGNGLANPYDGSGYSAIVFCGKIGGGVGTVKVNFHAKETDKSGGVCDSASNKCDDDFGASVTLGSDDPPYFGASIGGEYAVARERLGFGEGELERITRTAIEASFADDALKRALINRMTAKDGRSNL